MSASRISVALIGVVIAALAVGTADETDASLATAGPRTHAVSAVDPPLVAADAQTPWRYIGIAVPPPFPAPCSFATPYCPTSPAAVGSWSTTDLFGGAVIPPALRGFCAYESDAGDPVVLDDLVAMGCLTQIDPDSMSVTPLAQPQDFESLVWQPLHENFLAQAGALPSAAAPSQPRVRLTIVDTQPTQQLSEPGNALHGFSLAKMAEDLICTAGRGCGVDIRTRLALPYIKMCRGCTDPNGGYFGTVSELARALRLEVADWVASNANQPRDLVLNLSVGWDPRFGRLKAGPTGPVPVLAAYRALQDAACRGAIAVAAAGNEISGPDGTPGPLLPGGWEDLKAPGFEYCRSALEPGQVDPDDFPTGPAYRPLVYGAGAVGFDDSRVVARTMGEPPRVAFGDHVVGEALIDGSAGPTEMQTGTSVASLVVSAAAAATWHYSDDTPAYKLMANVYKSGRNLGRTAQYCLPPGPAACTLGVRRISVCGAVEAACDANLGALCPPPGSFRCAAAPTLPPELPFSEIDALYDDATIPEVNVATLTEVTTAPEECGASWSVRHDPADVVDDPCPHLQYYGIQATPWTDGQPASQPCPTCTDRHHSPGRLYIEIADEFIGSVSDVTVVCGNLGFRLPDATLPLAPDGHYLVTGIPQACASRLQVAYRVLNAGADDNVSALTRVLVYTRATSP
jgi:hypothetical protein